jgi:sugar lactone lactonase YvrE
MVVDAAGRAYVGNFGYDRHNGEAERTTCIALVGVDGSVVSAADDITFPNGMVITPDGKTLIVGETFAHRLTAFDISTGGMLTNRRVFAETPGCFPDGICLDAEGAVWVTNPQGDSVLRVFEGGRVAEKVNTGERRSFACMLGGADRRTLFILTNTGSGPAMAQKKEGRIETVQVDVPGTGRP